MFCAQMQLKYLDKMDVLKLEGEQLGDEECPQAQNQHNLWHPININFTQLAGNCGPQC